MLKEKSKLVCPYCQQPLTDFFRHETFNATYPNQYYLARCRNEKKPNHLKERTHMLRYGDLIGMCVSCKCGIRILK